MAKSHQISEEHGTVVIGKTPPPLDWQLFKNNPTTI
jgi:hypothetical protein